MVMTNYIPTVYKDDSEPFLEAANLNPSEQQLKKLTDAMRDVQSSLESGQVAQALQNLKTSVDDVVLSVDKKLDKTANAVSATKLKTARKINGVAFDGTKDIDLPVKTFEPTLLNGWKEHPTFGKCLVVKVDKICTLSGWLNGNNPWDESKGQVLELPVECRPKRDIAVNVATKGGVIPSRIMAKDGRLWLLPNEAGDPPSSTSDLAAFTVTYVIIDAED